MSDGSSPAPARATVDAVFARLVDHLIDVSPVAATQMGDHSRDHDLDDWGPGEADHRLRFVSELRADLEALGTTGDGEVDGDAVLIADALDATHFEFALQRAHVTDPLFYLGLATTAVYDLVRRDDLPVEPRAAAVASRIAAVPRLFEQAQAALTEVAEPHRELALLRLPGAVGLFGEVAPAFAPQAADAAKDAVDACNRFGAWLEERQGPFPDWRLGADAWAGSLRLALGVRMPAEELWQRAEERFVAGQQEMERLSAAVLGEAAQGLRGAELVRAGVAAVSADHPDRHNLVAGAAGVLDGIKDYIREWGEFGLPDPDTLKVEQVPPFQQGAVVAYFMPAPPLETTAAHTYYLSPIPEDWDDERAESFLREYNIHAVRSVGIHEGYPGHYVQQAFANEHPRLLRRVLWNAAFAEGWAIYVERRMVEHGFGGPGPDQARMQLISAKMQMRSAANALLDQGMHVHGWSDEQALGTLVGKAYQEQAEADAKVIRAKVSSGQLSTYFVGGEEMDDLRRDVEVQRGRNFDARQFHDDVLAQGTPPFPVLRRALLGEAAA